MAHRLNSLLSNLNSSNPLPSDVPFILKRSSAPPSPPSGWNYLSTFFYYSALISTFIACFITLSTIWGHLKHYRRPWIQRAIIRILWIVPLYAVASLISLHNQHLADYLDAIRGLYEAVILYVFFNLLIAYLGGERQLLAKLKSRPPVIHVFPFSLLLPQWDVSRPQVVSTMKKGILQFVLLKPIFALLTLILARTKNYEHSEISMTSTYLWVSLFYNLSVSWSMYCLLVLFFASKDILAHYRPLPKFLCIKFTLMFTFYQELLLSMLIPILHLYPDHVEPSHFAHALQSGLLCIEMSMCASLYQAAFNYMDYPPSPRLYVMDALRDAMGIKDVIIDIQRTWKGTKEHWSKADHVLAHLDTHRRTQLERLLLRFGVYRRFRSLTIDETQPLFIDSDRPYIEQEEVEPSETDFLEIDEEVDEEDDEKYETAVQDYGYRVIDDGGGQLENRREEFPRQWSHPYLI